MTSLTNPLPENEADLPSETTVLPTGTVVTVTITGWGGTNGTNAYRNYKIEVSNCFEDITITGGNMVGHKHVEMAMNRLSGVAEPQYYLQGEPEQRLRHWADLTRTPLPSGATAPTRTPTPSPFRWKREDGYYPRPMSP